VLPSWNQVKGAKRGYASQPTLNALGVQRILLDKKSAKEGVDDPNGEKKIRIERKSISRHYPKKKESAYYHVPGRGDREKERNGMLNGIIGGGRSVLGQEGNLCETVFREN